MGVGVWKPGGPLLLVLPNVTALLLLGGTFLILNWPPVSVKTSTIRINRAGLTYEKLERSRNCSRTCLDDTKLKECYFKFLLEPMVTTNRDCGNNTNCINADGFERTMVAVNGRLPGTPIQVCEGDVVVVDVENHLRGLETSLHWHGQFQHGTPYMDGAPMITQCPIQSDTSFRYTFRASNPGTHFYHSHYVSHHVDGIFGPLIVRQSRSHDPQFKLYDHDLDEHVITIVPWSHSLLAYSLDFEDNSNISSLLVNGKANLQNAEAPTKIEFKVRFGKRYRFRIINAAALDCPISFQVEGHDLTLIAADGEAVHPIVTSHIILYPGERYDAVLHANEKVSFYWIQVRGHHKCEEVHQEGLLVYDGAGAFDRIKESSFNSLTSLMLQKCLDIAHENCRMPALKSLHRRNDQELKNVRAERTLYIPYDLFTYNYMDDKIINFNFTFDDLPPYYPSYLYKRRQVKLPQMKGVTFLYSPSPLLTQRHDVPDSMLCRERCSTSGEFCECLDIVHIPLNISVDIVLIDEGRGSNTSNTFHLHGYNFHILGSKSLGHPLTVGEIEDLDNQGKLSRDLETPVKKDTVVVPNKGYAILRLFTSNPGYWLLEARSTSPTISEGTQLVLHIGEQNHLPSIPPKFPQCRTVRGSNFIF